MSCYKEPLRTYPEYLPINLPINLPILPSPTSPSHGIHPSNNPPPTKPQNAVLPLHPRRRRRHGEHRNGPIRRLKRHPNDRSPVPVRHRLRALVGLRALAPQDDVDCAVRGRRCVQHGWFGHGAYCRWWYCAGMFLTASYVWCGFVLTACRCFKACKRQLAFDADNLLLFGRGP
jgi:hypothetical protein